MLPQWVIEAKRDGHTLSPDDIRCFIEGYARGDIPDYQMSALAMAIYFQGMNTDEIATLTDVMMHTGAIIDTSSLRQPKADKHSTGGIGDKVSLILAPLVAACGVVVPMISGRGLGITGGTLDKLESIPGYRTDLSVDEFLRVLAGPGCSIIGQTAELAPADKKLYALRDVTGTVPSIPLIAASIMSKKLAEGTDALVLDIKHGSGAFMKSEAQAIELAEIMVAIGKQLGKGMSAVLTDMSQPLGRTAGNALEVVEAVEALQGNGPPDLMEVTLALAAEMLVLTGLAETTRDARTRCSQALADGTALERWRTMVERHGGDPAFIDNPKQLPQARIVTDLPAPETGTIAVADAEKLGRACVALGAGRRRVEDRVDHAVGLSAICKVGETIRKGDPLVTIHANQRERLDEVHQLMCDAFEICEGSVTPPALVGKVIR